MNEREPWRNSSCDNSCMFGSPGGMGTNGGCSCLESERNLQKRTRIRRGVLALKDGIKERDAEIAALREAVRRLWPGSLTREHTDQSIALQLRIARIPESSAPIVRRALEEKP